jgi:hypothetical protein
LKTTFVDSGLLIAVAQGEDDVYEEALSVLDDPEREFVSSVYVKLEVLPMATWLGREDQIAAYQEFFASVSRWIPSSIELSNRALDLAREHGLQRLALILAHWERMHAAMTGHLVPHGRKCYLTDMWDAKPAEGGGVRIDGRHRHNRR